MSGARGSFKFIPGTNPLQSGKVSAWLRLASGTITGSGYSSIPDVLGGTSPAVQATDARRPPNGTSANGLPIVNVTDHHMSWPLAAANNQATANGIACWCKSTLSGNQNLFAIYNAGSGASAAKVDYFLLSTTLQYFAEVGGLATKTTFMSANVWHFVTAEYEGALATDQLRCLLTVDGVVLASTNTAIPTSQPTPTGNASLLAFSPGVQPFIGSLGPNFWSLNGQLTASERSALMNFEAPT
jgi:hypothetical protein